MDKGSDQNRRRFVKLCASTIALVSANPRLLAQSGAVLHHYQRARLVHPSDLPIKLSDLKVGENYLFHYPYISTPCFLLNLGSPTIEHKEMETEDGRRYHWQGGVGPQRSIVAFSAICAHKMSHPARPVSFINYRHQVRNFNDKNGKPAQRSKIIYCCSENSVYDPAQGAQVLGGPAPQPLAAIRLYYNDTDGTLYATGVYGGEMFDKFFKAFSFRLSLEFSTSNIRKQVSGTARVMPLSDYCQKQILC